MIIRSLRGIAKGYRKSNNMLGEIPSEVAPHIMFETNGHGEVQLSDIFPKNIVLNASISQLPVESNAVLSRTVGDKLQKSVNLYHAPAIDSQSPIQNASFVCASVKISFENTGYAINDDGEKQSFIGTNFDDYQIVIDDNLLYTKQFLVTNESVHENVNRDGIVLENGKIASCVLYPYGGYYKYGIHPKQIESTICFLNKNSALNIVPISSVHFMNPTEDTLSSTNKYFIGVKFFSETQKQSLYDDIMKGECKFILKHKDQEKQFVSNALIWQEQTNLMQINFTSES